MVVRAIFEQAPVLPLRFGTVVTDSSSSVRLLEERHDAAQARLDEFTDHQEWGVRLFDTGDRETSSSGTSTSTGARMSGTAYLAQRRSELAAAEQRREFVAWAAPGTDRPVAAVFVRPTGCRGGCPVTDHQRRAVAATGTGVVDLLDRVIDAGAAVSGDVIISLAGVDLIRLDLRLLLAGVNSIANGPPPPRRFG
jgi:hypothetical protein